MDSVYPARVVNDKRYSLGSVKVTGYRVRRAYVRKGDVERVCELISERNEASQELGCIRDTEFLGTYEDEETGEPREIYATPEAERRVNELEETAARLAADIAALIRVEAASAASFPDGVGADEAMRGIRGDDALWRRDHEGDVLLAERAELVCVKRTGAAYAAVLDSTMYLLDDPWRGDSCWVPANMLFAAGDVTADVPGTAVARVAKSPLWYSNLIGLWDDDGAFSDEVYGAYRFASDPEGAKLAAIACDVPGDEPLGFRFFISYASRNGDPLLKAPVCYVPLDGDAVRALSLEWVGYETALAAERDPDGKRRLTVIVTEREHALLAAEAARRGVSVTALLHDLVIDGLDGTESNHG